jgi:DNA polymerase bacteriophage-type
MNTRLNVADLNAIETRVAAWIAGCEPLLQVFHEKKDPYLSFAVKMYGIPYETLDADLHSSDPVKKAAAKFMRQMAKPGVLAAVYRQGAGGMGKDRKTGDPKKLGLWGYAENMGIDMTLEEAQNITKVFRESYPEIIKMWYALEVVIKAVLLNRSIQTNDPEIQYALNRLNQIGIKFDKIVIDDRGNERVILRIQLPSGRYLHYVDAYIDDVKMPWTSSEGGEVYKPGLIYSGVDQETKQWKSGIVSHGGKIFENIVQAIARDVLADKLLEFEKLSLYICGHVHDEGISETDNDPFCPGYREMVHAMSQPVNWAPDLPLGADGFEDVYYHK